MKAQKSKQYHYLALRRFPDIRIAITKQNNQNPCDLLQNSSSKKEKCKHMNISDHSRNSKNDHILSNATATSNRLNQYFKSSAFDKLDNHLLTIRNENRKHLKNQIYFVETITDEIQNSLIESLNINSENINFYLERLITQLINIGFILEHPETDIQSCWYKRGIRTITIFYLYIKPIKLSSSS